MSFQSNPHHAQAVQAALAESARSGRMILVEYGGDWCIWSRRMTAVLAHPGIAALVASKFVFLRCHVGPDGSRDASSIEMPDLEAVPFFSLVGPDGRIIRNQAADGFECLWFYRKSAVLRFLQDWAMFSDEK